MLQRDGGAERGWRGLRGDGGAEWGMEGAEVGWRGLRYLSLSLSGFRAKETRPEGWIVLLWDSLTSSPVEQFWVPQCKRI